MTTIEMARRAGAVFPLDGSYHTFERREDLEAFAELVRADEREACAKVCETYNKRQCYNDEDMAVANECAHIIRARGSQ
jgi:hypothetical protein